LIINFSFLTLEGEQSDIIPLFLGMEVNLMVCIIERRGWVFGLSINLFLVSDELSTYFSWIEPWVLHVDRDYYTSHRFIGQVNWELRLRNPVNAILKRAIKTATLLKENWLMVVPSESFLEWYAFSVASYLLWR